jgi:hypothetical protein
MCCKHHRNEYKQLHRPDPTLILEFRGEAIRADMYAASRSWTPTARDPATGDILSLQWGGRPNYSISGSSSQRLPKLNLQGLFRSDTGTSEMVIKLLADGYNRAEILRPVEFSNNTAPIARQEPTSEWL